MDTEQRRFQFTLRDLLIGMAVVAVALFLVLAMLASAVRSARESGRGGNCRNNMRNLALALAQYEAARNRYPGYNNDLDPTKTGTPNNDRSWTFVLLPYMDHRKLFEELRNNQVPNSYDAHGNLVAGRIFQIPEVLLCPSMPDDQTLPSATSYVANSGQLDVAATSVRPADFPDNGVFHSGIRIGPDDRLTVMTASYIQANDGLGTTLLMSENADARAWSDTAERWTGFTWHHADGQPGPPVANPIQSLGLNVMTGKSRTGIRQSGAIGFARPSSHHPGGFNVVFCDSHTRFISDQISYRVYQALMTPMGAGARDNSDPAGAPLPSGHAATVKVDENELR